jgi:acyl-CoA synthetase (AMP-forming)/AMP-acid ligase II
VAGIKGAATMQGVWDILQQGEPDDAALVVPDGPRFSYRALRDEVQRGADVLCALGAGNGDVVASVFPNGAEAVLAFLSSAVAGCAAPLNPGYTEHEFSFYLNDVNPSILLVPPGKASAARSARPSGTRIVEAFLDPGGKLRLEPEGSPSTLRTASERAADDVALTLHTSGTTGRPKRVPLKQRHLAASVANIVETYGLGPTDVSICVMPLFHVHGLVASTLATFGSGGTVVVPAPFNPLRFWTVAAKHGATWFSAVPTMQHMLLARAKSQCPVPTLRFVRTCSAALSPDLMTRFEQRIGVPVLEAYGMTEACHQMASNPLPPGDRRPGSVGLATGVEVAVVDDEWNQLPTGQRGEVVVRGPNVIGAYADAPEANAVSFREGWFRTGDEGVLDTDGYLTLIGRLKELINRGGEKIAPREIDEVLLGHPAVAEAVAFAVPHAALGQDVAAAVVLRAPVTEAELLVHCRTRLAAFKVPRTIRIVDQLPRTATGKLQRGKVAESLGLGE